MAVLSVLISGIIIVTKSPPDRTIILDGEWEFFWNRLIVTDNQQDESPDFLIRVPGYWTKYNIDGKSLPAAGFGSYRLFIKGLQSSNPVTIFIPDFGCAYRVFVDGVLTAESGKVSKDLDEIFTVPRSQFYPAALSRGEVHEIVIEVASTRFSGLYKAPVLKDYDRALKEESRSGIRFILFGTVLFSFFILIIINLLSFRKRISSIWLSVLSILMILRIMLTNEFYSFWQGRIFFNLSYEDTNEFMFFVTFALKLLLFFMAEELLGVLFSRKEKVGFLLYYTAIYLIYFFIPNEIYNRYLTILLPASSFVLEIYSFFKIYIERHKLSKYGIIVYWGIILAISGIIIDCYYTNGNIYPNMSLALLMLLSGCLLILSLVSALQIAEVYKDLAVSSSRLELARSQISIQKEYYDSLSSQMNEIRGIKHDIRHFIGVIRSMLEEGHYDELKRFIGKYAEITETEPIPFFCENVVANSILGYYALKAKENGIPFHCASSIPKQLSISDSDICIVLGNALENAIEACRNLDNTEERFISNEVKALSKSLLIKIENSYNGNLNIQDGNYLSTKREKSGGIGLQNIKKVVESYGGYIKIEHDGKVFTLMAAFPLSAKQEDTPKRREGESSCSSPHDQYHYDRHTYLHLKKCFQTWILLQAISAGCIS